MFLHERRACLEAATETVRKSNGSENREREKVKRERYLDLKFEERFVL